MIPLFFNNLSCFHKTPGNGFPAPKKSEYGGNRPYKCDETIDLGHKMRQNKSNVFEIF